MNHFDRNNNQSITAEPWVVEAVEQLKKPLEASVASQLRERRYRVLERHAQKPRLPSFFTWGVPTLMGVIAIMVVIGLRQETDNDIHLLQTADNVVLEDLSIIKATDDLEFYQNLEFLLWMEQADNGLTKG